MLLTNVVLLLETGTAVLILFTRDTDLFLGVAVLATKRGLCGEGRRVLTFPSGVLGKADLELLGSLDLGACLGLTVLVGRGEDAEGNGDAGLKVQVDDCSWHERIRFSFNLPRYRQHERKDKKKDPLALESGGNKSRKKRDVEKERGLMGASVISFSTSFCSKELFQSLVMRWMVMMWELAIGWGREEEEQARRDAAARVLTFEGSVLGSPGWAAEEGAEGESIKAVAGLFGCLVVYFGPLRA